jgi:hypothetical protein
MNLSPISYYDQVTLRPLNLLGALHEPDMTIQVVPGYEADAEHGRISAEAPLGRAVLRKRCGDAVTIRVQDQSVSMKILAVRKAHETQEQTVLSAAA